MITVLVVDDQALMREGLVALLGLVEDISVVGEAGDGERALELCRDLAPDVVLMDLRMPVLDGASATARVSLHYPDIAVLVLTTYADDESISAALRSGARGYLTKNSGRAEIASAIRSAAAGQSTFAPEVVRRLMAGVGAQRRESVDGLTARETEVLRLIGHGKSNGEIAAELFIGEATVKTHINNVFAKISVRNRAEAVRYAFLVGLC